jgi:hypothetical protein
MVPKARIPVETAIAQYDTFMSYYFANYEITTKGSLTESSSKNRACRPVVHTLLIDAQRSRTANSSLGNKISPGYLAPGGRL